MGLTWQVVKTFSRIRPHWRAGVKQFENFHRKEHYYSPVPLISEVDRSAARIFDRSCRTLAGIDLNVDEQLRVLRGISGYYADGDFPEEPAATARYHLNNKFYPYTDGILYYGMIRLAQPRRIIEVGSGYSSAVCLDTNERFFKGAMQCTFIEPDTSRLDKLLTDDDRRTVRIDRRIVQDVGLDEFKSLESNDILFVDSSHVCKVGSDVNYILFEVLPSLASGVYVHFHDVFYPFEYPQDWVYRGVAWNEAYALRAFLQYNQAFQFALWSDYLQRFHQRELTAAMPLCRRNSGSLWLRKV